MNQAFLEFEPQGDSSITGGAILTDLGDNQTAVTIGVVAAGVTEPMPANIVPGTCTDVGAAASPAPSVAASAAPSGSAAASLEPGSTIKLGRPRGRLVEHGRPDHARRPALGAVGDRDLPLAGGRHGRRLRPDHPLAGAAARRMPCRSRSGDSAPQATTSPTARTSIAQKLASKLPVRSRIAPRVTGAVDEMT